MPEKIKIHTDFGSILPKNNIKKSKKLAVCAILSALGVVLMYIGAIFEVLDISMACIVSMFTVIAVIEIGGIYPWLLFAVTGTLSMLLLPQKFGAIIYVFMAGYYPMIKCLVERIGNRWLLWSLKLLFFNVALGAMIFAWVTFFAPVGLTQAYIVSFFVLGNITFAAFDVALSMLIRLYFFKYRKILGIGRILGERR